MSPHPEVRATLYCINHSWERRAPIIPSLLSDRPLLLLSTLFDLVQCARNYQYLLNAPHKARPCTGRGCRGLPDTGDALMRCPERSPPLLTPPQLPSRLCVRACVRAEDSRCSSTCSPRGAPSPEFHQRPWGGEPKPDLLQQQQQGKSWLTDVVNHLLLWIVIIAVLTTTRLPPITKKCVCARSPHGDETFGWVLKNVFFWSSCGIFIIYPLLLSCQCCLRVNPPR